MMPCSMEVLVVQVVQKVQKVHCDQQAKEEALPVLE